MTDKQFKYTVIIPHYVKQPGQTELVLRLLASLPPREDLQVLVVDNSPQPIDASTLLEQAGALARTASLEVLFSQSGCGAGRARNVGLQHARGRWLLFADADDYYASDCFDMLDRELEEETDILYYNVFGQGGRVARVHRYYEQYAKTQRTELVRYMIWAPWNKVIASQLVKEHGLQFEETSIGNDAMFSLNASREAKRIQIVQHRLYCLNDRAGSITFEKRSFAKELESLQVRIRINRFLMEEGMGRYRIDLVSPWALATLYRRYGCRQTRQYLKELEKSFPLGGELLRGSYAPLIRFGRRIKTKLS